MNGMLAIMNCSPRTVVKLGVASENGLQNDKHHLEERLQKEFLQNLLKNIPASKISTSNEREENQEPSAVVEWFSYFMIVTLMFPSSSNRMFVRINTSFHYVYHCIHRT
ncbi:hypothetical protein Q1695_009458 [Nippostrongylus brasiliensis]|nr:hypothetical protein Q1695_009458 [Nippostrongylus brasiliensis]